ncbi:origin recognition complex subunit 2 [Drechmeria coniospora]|uniref:Origin recognition complex subunit 2 n=1 Tax=Drechmeria coniospora TaxID=98403 RepID=A0A151GWU5_DRECN|nr:origin recognition complex subunit 2 [Drechmeria coniospora]KYK61576.1 origin recognition complex subunit 2 [Drechmeria coniospora]ODA79835.1 hypothetical protein RJ55_05431 [Drechmeria coniospora]
MPGGDSLQNGTPTPERRSLRKRSHDEAAAAELEVGSTPSKRRRTSLTTHDATGPDSQRDPSVPIDTEVSASVTEAHINGSADKPVQSSVPDPAKATPRKRGRPPKAKSTPLPEAIPTGTKVSEASTEVPINDGAPDPVMLSEPEPPAATPRRRGRPPKASSQSQTPTSKANPTPLFATPVKKVDAGSAAATPRRQAADRSARRKSARALIENAVRDGDSDDDDDNDELVREIYESEPGDDQDDDGGDDDDREDRESAVPVNEASTPSKTPQRRRRSKAKSPTPPRDLPPHELYFAHNKPGRPKTSDNTLADLALLSHDQYFSILTRLQDPHAAEVEHLQSLHAESFPQWSFELSQAFSLCLFGFGSKRALLRRFARHLHLNPHGDLERRTVVVNGYAHTTNMREILSVISDAIHPNQKLTTAAPATMVRAITAHLSASDVCLTLVVNSIDAPPLRKPGMQAALAQLALHPRVQLVCSADTPDFPLLWDIGLRSAFNFAFHDCTTFSPFDAELDVVDDVHELLGRTARRVNGREGVAFVLRSLPENAKNLFRLLVGEVLVAMEDEGNVTDEPAGVEYRMVYGKAVEEFICSSEMAFRTLLKEFHDHQMITSRKDALGTELLSVPFQKDELEAILEDLMS